MMVYVAFVNTKYEVMAVATTAEEAVQLASKKALEFLRGHDAPSSETDNIAKITEYFGVYAVPVEVGTAVLL